MCIIKKFKKRIFLIIFEHFYCRIYMPITKWVFLIYIFNSFSYIIFNFRIYWCKIRSNTFLCIWIFLNYTIFLGVFTKFRFIRSLSHFYMLSLANDIFFIIYSYTFCSIFSYFWEIIKICFSTIFIFVLNKWNIMFI